MENYFICLLNHVNTLFKFIFKPFQIYVEIFGFLFNLTKLKCVNDHSLKVSSINLLKCVNDENNMFLALKIM